MLRRWYRDWRRKKWLKQPFPADWEQILQTHFRHFCRLTAEEQDRLRRHVQILVAEKYWEGCHGVQVTDEMRVTIAAHAGYLNLARPLPGFERVLSILIYPQAFLSIRPQQIRGQWPDAPQAALGEAVYRGPVILSWEDCLKDCIGPATGHNVMLHEFAHQLDMEDGAVDGFPLLNDRAFAASWKLQLDQEFDRLERHLRTGRGSVFDAYGSKNRVEFFAVATEAFFENPQRFEAEHGAFYALMARFFGQDPAARFRATS